LLFLAAPLIPFILATWRWRAPLRKSLVWAACILFRLICRRTSRSGRSQIPRFVPSLLDAHTGQPNYSIDTVRRLKNTLKKNDKLYFLIGMDAFKDIATWRQPEELLAEVEFIVASRPGYSLADVGRALPVSLRPTELMMRAMRPQRANGTIALMGAIIHLLGEVKEKVSSTQIRAAAGKSVKQLSRYVPPQVAEYIKKENLYVGAPSKESTGASPDKVLSFQEARQHGQTSRSHKNG
jgi:nicotinate (nicotinamide) nucleotide adenylyltransferase